MADSYVCPTLPSETISNYREIFQTVDDGIEYVLEMFPVLFKNALSEIRGRFSKKEVMLIIRVMSGLILSPQLAGQYIVGNVLDRIGREDLLASVGIEKSGFLEKLRSLNIFQRACLEIWANSYWYQGGKPYEDSDALNRYMETLI